jgi:hypothetical protein
MWSLILFKESISEWHTSLCLRELIFDFKVVSNHFNFPLNAVHFLRKWYHEHHMYTANGINGKKSNISKSYINITLIVRKTYKKYLLQTFEETRIYKARIWKIHIWKVKERCEFSLVWPHLEYSQSIWDPAHKCNTNMECCAFR